MTNPPHHFRRTTHSARALQPYIVWGAPGCAKSQSHSSSRLYGHEYIDVRALLLARSICAASLGATVPTTLARHRRPSCCWPRASST